MTLSREVTLVKREIKRSIWGFYYPVEVKKTVKVYAETEDGLELQRLLKQRQYERGLL